MAKEGGRMNGTALLLAIAVLNEVTENHVSLGNNISIEYCKSHSGTVGPGAIKIITIVVPREEDGT